MKTRQQRALQLYDNCLSLGCGFMFVDNRALVMAPSADGVGQPHPALQSVLDCYQAELCELIPRHGVQPDRLRPAPVAGKPDDSGDKMAVIRKGVESAAKCTTKKQAQRRQKRKPAPRRYSYQAVAVYEP